MELLDRECSLLCGDAIALYTDGITESFNAAGAVGRVLPSGSIGWAAAIGPVRRAARRVVAAKATTGERREGIPAAYHMNRQARRGAIGV